MPIKEYKTKEVNTRKKNKLSLYIYNTYKYISAYLEYPRG